MAAELSIVIRARNDAQKVFKEVSEQARGVGDVIGGLQSKLGAGLKVAALGGAAGLGVAAFALKSFIGDAMAAQKVQAQTNAVLKSTQGAAGLTAEAVGDLADALSRVTPVDDEVIQSAENMLLTFTNISKDVFPQATETALDMSVALGEDATQAALQLGKALNDPIGGVTALRRVGVQLTDAQEAMVKQMVDAGDVMGAQKVILQELQKEFGGSARAAGDTFAGKMKILSTQIDNVKERIGLALLPVLTKLADLALKYVVPAIEDAVAAFGDFAGLIAAVASGDSQKAIELFSRLPKPLQEVALWLRENSQAIADFGQAVADAAQTVADAAKAFYDWANSSGLVANFLLGLKTVWEDALQPALQWLLDHKVALAAVFTAIGIAALLAFTPITVPVLAAVAAMTLMLITIGYLRRHWDDITDFLDERLGFLKDAFEAVFPAIAAEVTFAFDTVKNVVTTAIAVVRDIVKIGLAVITGDWGAAWEGVKQLVRDVWDGITAQLGSFLDVMQTRLAFAWEAVKWVAAAAWGGVKDIILGVWEGIKGGIRDALNWIIDRINSFASHVNRVTGLLGKIPGVAFPEIPSIPHLARGGFVDRAGLALVGEKGPEAVFMPRGAAVLPTDITRALLKYLQGADTQAAGVRDQRFFIDNVTITGDPVAGLAALGAAI